MEGSRTWWQGDCSSWFVRDFPDFITASPMFRETPQTRADQDGWSPYLLTRELPSPGKAGSLSGYRRDSAYPGLQAVSGPSITV